MELRPSAARHPPRRGPWRGARRRRSVHPRVPRRTTAAERAAASRPAAGGAAGRRGRPRRRRVRGVPVRAAGGVVGDDPRARHAARRVPADRRADVEPHPRPARCAQAAMPLPLDRLPGPATCAARSSGMHVPAARSVARRPGRRRRLPAAHARRAEGTRASPRRSGGSPRSEVLGFEVLDAEAAELTIGSVLKYRDDAELAADRSYDWVATG